MKLWYILLQQATISLNLIIQSITIPHLSAYTHIFGEFYFNCTPLAPPGTQLVVHNRANYCASWAPHGKDGWYIGPEMEHYIFHKTYIPNTRGEIISDTVEFFPKQSNIPKMSSIYATFHAAHGLIYLLQNTSPSNPLYKPVNRHKETFTTLA